MLGTRSREMSDTTDDTFTDAQSRMAATASTRSSLTGDLSPALVCTPASRGVESSGTGTSSTKMAAAPSASGAHGAGSQAADDKGGEVDVEAAMRELELESTALQSPFDGGSDPLHARLHGRSGSSFSKQGQQNSAAAASADDSAAHVDDPLAVPPGQPDNTHEKQGTASADGAEPLLQSQPLLADVEASAHSPSLSTNGQSAVTADSPDRTTSAPKLSTSDLLPGGNAGAVPDASSTSNAVTPSAPDSASGAFFGGLGTEDIDTPYHTGPGDAAQTDVVATEQGTTKQSSVAQGQGAEAASSESAAQPRVAAATPGFSMRSSADLPISMPVRLDTSRSLSYRQTGQCSCRHRAPMCLLLHHSHCVADPDSASSGSACNCFCPGHTTHALSRHYTGRAQHGAGPCAGIWHPHHTARHALPATSRRRSRWLSKTHRAQHRRGIVEL